MTNNQILEFKTYLINEEKSKATIEKYIRDVVACMMTECPIDKSRKDIIGN